MFEFDMLNSIIYNDSKGLIRKRKNSYSCLFCGKQFDFDRFPLLPAVNGYLVCDECYRRESPLLLKDRPYCGGYLVDLIDTIGIDGYAFSHSALLTVRAVAFNEVAGYFYIVQQQCDQGCGYYAVPMDEKTDIKNAAEAMENSRQRMTEYHLFHPLLLLLQRCNINAPGCTILNNLRGGRLCREFYGRDLYAQIAPLYREGRN